MTHTYDWSKLDAGWRHNSSTLSECHGSITRLEDGGTIVVDALEKWIPHNGEHLSWTKFKASAKTQLAKCRIHAPDVATVTELRPRDEYDWSRLEGSGWRHDPEVHGHHMISNGKFEWWYDSSEPGKLMLHNALAQFDAHNALVAQQEAERLVAKCRRDWRDEVKQACEGTGFMFLMEAHGCQFHHSQWCLDGPSARLEFTASRTYRLLDALTSTAQALAVSVIIERLKKLGWREA